MSDYNLILSLHFYTGVRGIILKYLEEFKGKPIAGFGYNVYEIITLTNGTVVYTCENCPYIYFWSISEQRAIKTLNGINISLSHISGDTFAAIYMNIVFIYEKYELKETIANTGLTLHYTPPYSNIGDIISINGRYWITICNELHIDHVVETHAERISNIVSTGDLVIVSDWSGHITIYSSSDGRRINTIKYDAEPHTEFDYAFIAANNSLIYAHNKSLFLSSISDQKEIKQDATISHMGLLHNGNLIIGNTIGMVSVYDSYGNMLKTFSVSDERILWILELQCGNLLVSVRYSVILVNSDGIPLTEFPGIYAKTYQLPDGKVVMADTIIEILK